MKNRNTNIEILRIISIIMIVFSHYSIHNVVSPTTLSFGFNRLFLEVITLGDIGTIVFVLITGYCLIRSSEFKLRKIIKLWLQIVFYSLIIYFAFIMFLDAPFSLKSLIKCLLPITFNQYWFASVYFVLYIFHPFINKMLNSLSRKEHVFFIIISLTFFSVLHMLTTKTYYGNELIQFIMFYSIGAYFSKYKDSLLKNNKINFSILVLSSMIIIISILLFDVVGKTYSIFALHSRYFLNRTSFFSILIAIALLNLFVNRKCWSNKIINTISSCVFGIYLISDNYYLRNLLWLNIFNNSKYVFSNLIVIHSICSVFIVIIVCLFIELFRNKTVEMLLSKICYPFIDRIQGKIGGML